MRSRWWRPTKSRLFDLTAFVSLLLCVAISVLWVRSYYRVDILGQTTMPREGKHWYWQTHHMASKDGGIWVFVMGRLVTSPKYADIFAEKVGERYYQTMPPRRFAPPDSFAVNYWFRFHRWVDDPPRGMGPLVLRGDGLSLRLPYWPVVLLTGALSAFWLVRRRREARRARTGECIHCGYSLIGNTSDICPECGREIQTAVECSPK